MKIAAANGDGLWIRVPPTGGAAPSFSPWITAAPSYQVIQAPRAVDDALDHRAPISGGEQDEVAAVNGLPQAREEIVPSLKGPGPFGNPGTDSKHLFDEGLGGRRIVRGDEIADGFQILHGLGA